jgi:hypothetical protein
LAAAFAAAGDDFEDAGLVPTECYPKADHPSCIIENDKPYPSPVPCCRGLHDPATSNPAAIPRMLWRRDIAPCEFPFPRPSYQPLFHLFQMASPAMPISRSGWARCTPYMPQVSLSRFAPPPPACVPFSTFPHAKTIRCRSPENPLAFFCIFVHDPHPSLPSFGPLRCVEYPKPLHFVMQKDVKRLRSAGPSISRTCLGVTHTSGVTVMSACTHRV